MSSAVSAPLHEFPDTGYRDLSLQEVLDNDLSGDEDSVAEEGEVSADLIDKQDQTEDMTYRETVRSVCSFMGWNHIPIYESDLSEPDKSNNPWKGKNTKKPARISVAMPPPPPPDNWLCQKLEKLKTTVGEGYPSRAQDSAGLKRDLSTLNLFLETKTFKMETPETIRLSLQQGEWVTLLDFSDAYFHIPIAQRSRKYLRFHLNKVTC